MNFMLSEIYTCTYNRQTPELIAKIPRIQLGLTRLSWWTLVHLHDRVLVVIVEMQYSVLTAGN